MVQFIKTKYQVKPTFLWKETSADKYNLFIILEREENSPNDWHFFTMLHCNQGYRNSWENSGIKNSV